MKSISTFVIAFIIVGFFFMALPERGYSGIGMIPPCPCDILALPDGTTGNDIVEFLCPGGQLRDDAGLTLDEDELIVFLQSTTYSVLSFIPESGTCGISQDGFGAGAESLSSRVTLNCRNSLIERCGLNINQVPTLSQWGLIAMAGILGIVGLMVIRRRKVAA